MALFQVPGWSMPSDPRPASVSNTKKRKRPSSHDLDQIQLAEVNIEKLMKKLDQGRLLTDGKRKCKDVDDLALPGKRGRSRSKKGALTAPDTIQGGPSPKARPEEEKIKNAQVPVKSLRERGQKRGKVDSSRETAKLMETPQKDKVPKKQTKEKNSGGSRHAQDTATPHVRSSNLTPLQASMKHSLDGARFRWINEVLYKSDSNKAHQMMRDDPEIYEEYHAGFRHQVTSWPSNPVQHYISSLSSYPKGTAIVDLGCGDAALARELVPKGYTVLSYDLIAGNPFIIEADICSKLPLPGAEDSSRESQVVDVVVCSLSLMSTNWLNCIREIRRVLKLGGELKIAEVSSRFTDVQQFTSVICSIGFKLQSKDERNSHFTLFEFQKIERQPLTENVWKKISSRGEILHACEYKRR